jgi:hypothetical protein
MDTLFGLLGCRFPPSLKALVLQTLAAFAHNNPSFALAVWDRMERSQIIPTAISAARSVHSLLSIAFEELELISLCFVSQRRHRLRRHPQRQRHAAWRRTRRSQSSLYAVFSACRRRVLRSSDALPWCLQWSSPKRARAPRCRACTLTSKRSRRARSPTRSASRSSSCCSRSFTPPNRQRSVRGLPGVLVSILHAHACLLGLRIGEGHRRPGIGPYIDFVRKHVSLSH